MNLADHVRRQFAYDAWANREVFDAIRSNSADSRSIELMLHILAAEQVWYDRLRQQPQSVSVWPKSDLAHCESHTAQLAKLWTEYLDLVTAGDLSLTISYKNSKGESWTSTVGDILTHVILHSAYHRGQIASHMRESGLTPAYTDFIHGVRQGFVE